MKLSQMFLHTQKEDPREAEVVSHKLMIRAAMIKKLASGIYSYMPYGLKALRKVEQIVREEMDSAGAQEVLMPAVQPAELWQESGRWDFYGRELLRFKDRKDADFCLGPTHEEVITDMARSEIQSYKDLPQNLYQIQAKFRDEIRPRFGVMRSREFIMKDAYSFDVDDASAEKSYENMFQTYSRIFERCGLKFKPVEADSGQIGGSFSHEFMVLAETGEDAILSCDSCGYAANVEKAAIRLPENLELAAAPAGEPVKVHTPDARTIEEVSAFLKIEASNLVKTMIYDTDQGVIAALVRGDHEVNEAKLRAAAGCESLELAEDAVIAEVTKAPRGFAGPIGLQIRVIADASLICAGPFVAGANEADHHVTDLWLGRDAKVDLVADIRNALEGDSCPRCQGKLEVIRGIEVGHVFKLGTKYSKAMNAEFLDEEGKAKPMVMGCYGIGISRVVAAAIEQNHDENGIIFPVEIAPYPFLVQPLDVKPGEVMDAATKIYDDLRAAGFDVLIDDRKLRPGVKFKDADLLGVPYRITVGGKGLAEGIVELKNRRSGEMVKIELGEVVKQCQNLI